MIYTLKDFQGTYLGVIPTDKSPILIGEFEVSVTQKNITTRLATGSNIDEENIDGKMLTPMTLEDISDHHIIGQNYVERLAGFRTQSGEKYIFLKDANKDQHGREDFGLVVVHTKPVQFQIPGFLFNQEQIERGEYKRFTEVMFGINPFPRIKYDGRFGL